MVNPTADPNLPDYRCRIQPDQMYSPEMSGYTVYKPPLLRYDCALVFATAKQLRKGVRVVEGARLESVYTATYQGFESLPFRHYSVP